MTRCFFEVQTREVSVCVCVCVCVCVRARAHAHTHIRLCLTLCDPMDCSLPGSSVYGIFQAKIQGQVAISHSRGSFQPRDKTLISCVSCTGRRILFFFFFLYWRIITLQNFVVFCQTSTWISHRQILYLCTTWEVHREKRPHFKLCRGIIAFHSHLLSSDCMSDCQDKFMKWLFYFNFHRGECKTSALKRSENSVR